jgi:hypothetical protein
MKRSIIFFIALNIMAVFTSIITAQTTANTSAGVKILTPLSISEAFPMNFGTIGVEKETGGTVIISTDGARSSTNGVTLSSLAPFFSLSTITITHTDNSSSMTISSLLAKSASGTESNSATGTLLAETGSESFTVGGTLTVEAAQLAGIYSGTFRVTVAYN